MKEILEQASAISQRLTVAVAEAVDSDIGEYRGGAALLAIAGEATATVRLLIAILQSAVVVTPQVVPPVVPPVVQVTTPVVGLPVVPEPDNSRGALPPVQYGAKDVGKFDPSR